MYYTVYKITNTINNKIYIGCHKTSNLDDDYMGSGKILKRSIIKYGINSFTKEYLHIFDNADEMFNMESQLVNDHFIKEDTNYNLKVGGEGGFDYLNRTGLNNSSKSQEQLSRGGLVHKNRIETDPEYATKLKNRSSKTLKKAHKDGKIKYDNFTGKKHSDRSKEKMSETKKRNKFQQGKNNSQYGTHWYCNGDVGIEGRKRYKKGEQPSGWITTTEYRNNMDS